MRLHGQGSVGAVSGAAVRRQLEMLRDERVQVEPRVAARPLERRDDRGRRLEWPGIRERLRILEDPGELDGREQRAEIVGGVVEACGPAGCADAGAASGRQNERRREDEAECLFYRDDVKMVFS
jgi:hypothetical protein